MVRFMAASLPISVRECQPISVQDVIYRPAMTSDPGPTDPRSYLWENVCALVGETKLNSVHARINEGREPGDLIPRGNLQRLMERKRSYIDTLAQIAGALGVDVWQLLVPGLSRACLPVLAADGWPFFRVAPSEFSNLNDRDKGFVDAKLAEAIAECRRASASHTTPPIGANDKHTESGQDDRIDTQDKALPGVVGRSANKTGGFDDSIESDIVPSTSGPKPRGSGNGGNSKRNA